MKLNRKLMAFTLAEVLLTLGIIGIIAAITLPTLITKTQNQEYVTALKKAYSNLDNCFEQILAQEGVDVLSDTSLFGTASCSIPGSYGFPQCEDFFKNLRKYLRFDFVDPPEGYSYNDLNNDGFPISPWLKLMVLQDGAIILNANFGKQESPFPKDSIAAAGGHVNTIMGNSIYIDVNGFKKPNRLGRDIFEFILSDDGKLYPYGGSDECLFNSGNNTLCSWKTANGCGKDENNTDISSSGGNECAARIIEEGWQMNY